MCIRDSTWGNILSDARGGVLAGRWWQALFPGLAIMITVLCLNILSEGCLLYTSSRRTFLAGSAVAAAAAGLTLAGCGGGGETTDTPSTDAGTDAGAAAQGGTLTGAMAYTSTNVNPIGNSSALMLAATWHVFEGLYEMCIRDSMGSIDLVLQVAAPPSVASAPQRIGRANHQVGGRSTGSIFPRTRTEIIDAAVAAEGMYEGRIEQTALVKNALDVLEMCRRDSRRTRRCSTGRTPPRSPI